MQTETTLDSTQGSKILTANAFSRPSTILLAMLSLSIGWGIRGNFGHEYGAMIPGMLCAVAIGLFSDREDWRRRVPFLALFGAIGWAFGGSMSYMPPLGYTHSGYLPTQLYGFFGVFAIGFLWASMGAAGTAYAVVEEREKLTAIFKPLCWVLAVWALNDIFLMVGPKSDFRQTNPLYWLDSDWVPLTLALLALCACDLWDRRFEKSGYLAAFGAGGAAVGFGIQKLLMALGWLSPLLGLLVRKQGDLLAINPETGQPFDPNDLITNWPTLFTMLGAHMGWILGLAAGVAVYFARYGKWRNGASLPLYMALGGWGVFLLGPVLLNIHMVPPRGDNWAVVIGILLGAILYMRRNGLGIVARAALMGGVLGGLGLMVAQFLKMLAYMPGNPLLTQDPATIRAWAHWHSANWHSIATEQVAGLFYGLGTVLTMAMVSAHTKPVESEPRTRRWTEVFAVSFILNLLTYLNLVKNIGDWTRQRVGGFQSVPSSLKAPLFGEIELSAAGWFRVVFILFTICTVTLLARHLRRPLAIAPESWLGRGQLFYVLFLWIVVIGNFEKALVAFHEQRLATEGAITVNALIATFIILFYARNAAAPKWTARSPAPLIRKTVFGGLAAMAVLTVLFTTVEHEVYGDRHDGFGGQNIRFGPNADWRLKPILKSHQHR
ncbi:MAG: hypothetical protein J2P21_08935 [Chloracidobacterium sp.]|nr:hypothetical protein [Chloracidobacterium sp.]